MADYLNSKQVAKIYGVDFRTIYRWKNQGKIPFHQLPGGEIRFDSEELQAWWEKRQVVTVEQAVENFVPELSTSDVPTSDFLPYVDISEPLAKLRKIVADRTTRRRGRPKSD